MNNNGLLPTQILFPGDRHAERIEMALKALKEKMPCSPKFVENMTEMDIYETELLIFRFGKLQDFVGQKVIDLVLETLGENTESLSIIDKLNRLEKLKILGDKSIWKDMRELRNHLSHEYPGHPEIMAKNLNDAYKFSRLLIDLYRKFKEIILRGERL